MARFKLLLGRHIQKDPKNPGQSLRFHPGDTVESDVDLVKRHGAEKFARIDPVARRMRQSEGEAAAKFRSAPVAIPMKEGLAAKLEAMGEDEEADLSPAPIKAKDAYPRKESGRVQRTQRITEPDAEEYPDDEDEYQTDIPLETQETEEEEEDDEGEVQLDKPLEQMNVRELTKLANQHDISLKGATRKDEMIKALKEGLSQ